MKHVLGGINCSWVLLSVRGGKALFKKGLTEVCSGCWEGAVAHNEPEKHCGCATSGSCTPPASCLRCALRAAQRRVLRPPQRSPPVREVGVVQCRALLVRPEARLQRRAQAPQRAPKAQVQQVLQGLTISLSLQHLLLVTCCCWAAMAAPGSRAPAPCSAGAARPRLPVPNFLPHKSSCWLGGVQAHLQDAAPGRQHCTY